MTLWTRKIVPVWDLVGYVYFLYTLGGQFSLEFLFFFKTQNYYHIIVQCLSQDFETGCLKLAVVKYLGVQIFKGDHKILIFQPQTCINSSTLGMISLNYVMEIIRWKNSIISLRFRFLEIPHKEIWVS